MGLSAFDPLVLLLVLVGPAVGSFMALVADRFPRGEGVVLAGSACRACGARLGWADKLPLVSYLALRGRCRHCGGVIAQRLWVAEALGLLIPVLAAQVAASPAQLALGCGFLWCLLGLGLCDLQAFRLPDALTGALAALGLGLAAEDPARGLPDGLAAGAVALGLFWGLRLAYRRLRGREGLGLGDVKLMGGIGAGVGLAGLPVVTLVAAGAAIAGALVLGGGWRRGAGHMPIPFGAYLAGAAGLVWLAIA